MINISLQYPNKYYDFITRYRDLRLQKLLNTQFSTHF